PPPPTPGGRGRSARSRPGADARARQIAKPPLATPGGRRSLGAPMTGAGATATGGGGKASAPALRGGPGRCGVRGAQAPPGAPWQRLYFLPEPQGHGALRLGPLLETAWPGEGLRAPVLGP